MVDNLPLASGVTRAAAEVAADGGPALVDLPPGVLAAVVTWLEMPAPAPDEDPVRPDPPGTAGLRLVRWRQADPDAYRHLFRAVGKEWMWFARLQLDNAKLAAILHDPAVTVFRAEDTDGTPIGLLELDFRDSPDRAELAYFGLTGAAIGTGAGRWLMNRAMAEVWHRPDPPARLVVHTCTLDHPAALDFYRRSGFRPLRRAVELVRDPRLSGALSADAAPRVPLI